MGRLNHLNVPKLIYRLSATRGRLKKKKSFILSSQYSIFSILDRYLPLQEQKMTCSYIRHVQRSFQDSTRQPYQIRDFIKCSTSFVVYCFTCPCGVLQNNDITEDRITWFTIFAIFHNKEPSKLGLFGIQAISQCLSDSKRFSYVLKRLFRLFNQIVFL